MTDPATITGGQPTHALAPDHLLRGLVDRPDAVGHDELVRIGPIVDQVEREASENPGGLKILVETDLPGLAERVATGSEQGRTTVVVLIVQLLVLVAVVLWMVLVAATDDRRAELALARLRGRGRRGAAAYLLSELVPLTLAGVVVGILAAPLAMALVARVVFPVPVPNELPAGSCSRRWAPRSRSSPWCSQRPDGPCASRSTRSCGRSRPGTPARGPAPPRSR